MSSNVYGRITGGPTGITGSNPVTGYGANYSGNQNNHHAHGHGHGNSGTGHGTNNNDSNFHNNIGPEDYLEK